MSTLSDEDQFFSDVLCTAIEGGTGYWATVMKTERDDSLNYLSAEVYVTEDAEPVAAETGLLTTRRIPGTVMVLEVGDVDEAVKRGRMDASVIKKVTVADIKKAFDAVRYRGNGDGGIQVADRYVQRFRAAYTELDAGDLDADDADIIFQHAALGEVVFG